VTTVLCLVSPHQLCCNKVEPSRVINRTPSRRADSELTKYSYSPPVYSDAARDPERHPLSVSQREMELRNGIEGQWRHHSWRTVRHWMTSSVLVSPTAADRSVRHFLFIVNRRWIDGSSQSQWRETSRDTTVGRVGVVNWKEPHCRRDYADAATGDVEELAFMRLVRAIEPPASNAPRLSVEEMSAAVDKSRSISTLQLLQNRGAFWDVPS